MNIEVIPGINWKYNLKKKIARIVSLVFDGSILVIPVFLTVLLKNDNSSAIGDIIPFFVSLIFLGLLPYLFIVYLYKTKKICDLQMPNRKERFLPLIFFNLSMSAGFVILLLINSSELIKTIYSIYLIGVPILSFITLFWKISFHTSYVTVFSLVYIVVFGKWAFFTVLFIPLMMWARVELKRHTKAQTIAGITVTGFITLSVFSLYGKESKIYDFFRNIINSSGSLLTGFGLYTQTYYKDLLFSILIVIIMASAYRIRLNRLCLN